MHGLDEYQIFDYISHHIVAPQPLDLWQRFKSEVELYCSIYQYHMSNSRCARLTGLNFIIVSKIVHALNTQVGLMESFLLPEAT
jgi:hypothetical protein